MHMTTVFVLGATPGGVAAAVRAAREGHEVTVATYNDVVGGMFASGICTSDAQYKAPRASIYDEFVAGVREHYRTEYGTDSEEYARCNDGYGHEPHVAATVMSDLVASEENLTVLWRRRPRSVERDDRSLRSVTLESFDGEVAETVHASTFVDATYEGDLAAVAGCPYRVGRESRDEYGEQHAGRLFTHVDYVHEGGHPRVAADGALNVNPFPLCSAEIIAGSTGEGDDAIQSYTSRLTLTRDPENRRRPERPDDYDRDRYAAILRNDRETADESHPLKSRLIRSDPDEWTDGLPEAIPIPGDKRDFNAGNFVGRADEYPEADWGKRERIIEAHHRHAEGLLYFLQNDHAVPDGVQEQARQWGLSLEDGDDEGRPHQIYVREARRIVGQATFTEHDARIAPGLDRPPVHDDAVAIADWLMDCHDVRPVRRRGSEHDGNFFLGEVTRPSQVPYRAMLPRGLDDLLVPVALSASHVGFQTLRLEPTWMGIGEAAGMAAALAVERDETPGALDVAALQGALADRRCMLAFVNEGDMSTDAPWVEAVQFCGTKGFFRDFDARPEEPLDGATAEVWAATTAAALSGECDATRRARRLPAPGAETDPISPDAFVDLLEAALEGAGADPAAARNGLVPAPGDPITRGTACRLAYRLHPSWPNAGWRT